MRIVNAKCGSVIPIGRLGENDAVQVIFDVASWKQTYGNGTFNLLNKRNGDANAYPCDVIEDNGKLLWNINSADVANVGYGQCEIVYIVGDTIAKSEIYTTIVGKALTGGGDVPEPWEDWVERVLQAGADADEAVNLWQNMTAVGVEADEAFADYDNGVLTIGIPASGGGGTSDHRQLSNRDAANQHPISAIDGLQSALDGKQPIGDYATTQDVSDLADIVDTKADASDIPSLDGYATEQWVENKGYLTEHQSLDGYATETYVNNHHDSTKQDKLTAGENITIVDNVISAAGGGGGDEWELINEVTIPAGATEANRFSFTQDFNGQPIHLKKAMVLYYYPKYEGSSTPPGFCFASVNNITSGPNAPLAYTSGFCVPSKTQNRSGYYIVEIGGYGLPYNECAHMTEMGVSRKVIGSAQRTGVLKCYCTNGIEPAPNEITEIGTTGALVYEGCYFALYGVRK